MRDRLQEAVCRFVNDHIDLTRPILLALSGGPDSIALFSLLSAVPGLSFAVAHVDHGWREESSREAEILERIAREHSLPYHCKRLAKLEGNLEESARKERYSYFASLCGQFGYQGVAVGHHFDDQSETVLKRVLEGASLTRLGGMASSSIVEDVQVYRPLLPFDKQEIANYLFDKDLSFFNDPTNKNLDYLRARFREKIIPDLERSFGKKVGAPLCKLAAESARLRHFLDEQSAPYLALTELGPWGSCLDLDQLPQPHPYLMRHLLKCFCEAEGFRLSYCQLEALEKLVARRVSGKSLSARGQELLIDRGRLFHILKKPEVPKDQHPLVLGEQDFGSWKVNVSKVDRSGEKITGWRRLWEGRAQVFLKQGEYSLRCAEGREYFPGGKRGERAWSEAKVPAFLRRTCPVICCGHAIVEEFLTGRGDVLPSECSKLLSVEIIAGDK